MNNVYISLPAVLYILGIIALIVLIILGVKLLFIMNNVDKVVKDVNGKVKSLNGIFSIIDVTADRLSFVTDRFVDAINGMLLKVFKKKKVKEENENE